MLDGQVSLSLATIDPDGLTLDGQLHVHSLAKRDSRIAQGEWQVLKGLVIRELLSDEGSDDLRGVGNGSARVVGNVCRRFVGRVSIFGSCVVDNGNDVTAGETSLVRSVNDNRAAEDGKVL